MSTVDVVVVERVAEPGGLRLGVAVEELSALVLRAEASGLDRDLLVVDRLESSALRLWVVACERLGLPAWRGLAAPSNRWVVLERSVARLATRVMEGGLGELLLDAAVVEDLDRARAAIRGGQASR